MDLGQHLRPRDEQNAARTASTLCLIAAFVTTLTAVLVPPPDSASQVLAFALPAVLFTLGGLLRRGSRRRSGRANVLLAVTPMVGVLGLAVLDVATRDASAGAQVFLCFPVIYAASQLRPGVATVTTGMAVVGDVVIVFTVEPWDKALVDLLYVCTTLIVVTGFLIAAGRRQDELVNQLRRQAAIDPLTGLVTRRVLDDAARSALTADITSAGTALMIMDLDRFKVINDTHGHPIGDEALIHLAGLLTQHVRADSIISRLGGDEIAVLLPGCPYDVATGRAEQIVAAVRDHPLILPDGTPLPLSVSVGVAHVPMHASDLTQLYAVADRALYDAKRQGRGRVGRLTEQQPQEAT
jgi:diguanylate cyclase (GGDEF)-like protein